MFLVLPFFCLKVNLIFSRCSGRPKAWDANQCDGGRCFRGMGHQVPMLILGFFSRVDTINSILPMFILFFSQMEEPRGDAPVLHYREEGGLPECRVGAPH